MDSEWIGKTVSLDCGGVGFFQGVIDSVHLDEQTITLKNAFQNGVECKMSSVTIRADHIEDLKLLEEAKNGANKSTETSTVAVRKKPRPQVADNLAKFNLSNRGNNGRSPRVQEHHRGSPKKGVERHESFQGGFRTPNKRLQQMIQRDNDCFGAGIDDSKMYEEFDFEKNLALFDKQSVYKEIELENSNQPDVVRLVDCNRRQKNETPDIRHRSEMEPKYRNDQNVLSSIPAQYRQITLDKSSANWLRGEYSTDAGLVVPGVDLGLRERLLSAAEARGISKERLAEIMARSVTDMTIQMLGGARRLNPENRHQVPKVVALCGPGRSGSYGLASLRHLASQGVHTCGYLPSFPMYPAHINSELHLYKLCIKKRDHVLIHDADELPGAPDVVLLALDDHEMLEQERAQPWHRIAINWARNSGALILALDPPTPDKASAELAIKASMLPGLPLWYPDDTRGKLHMANLVLPPKVYKDVGISYSSPFGAKTFTTLNLLK